MNDEIRECYRQLELEPGAPIGAVKEAYRDLLKVWHPDRFPNDPKFQGRATEKTKTLNEACQKITAYLAGNYSESRASARARTAHDDARQAREAAEARQREEAAKRAREAAEDKAREESQRRAEQSREAEEQAKRKEAFWRAEAERRQREAEQARRREAEAAQRSPSRRHWAEAIVAVLLACAAAWYCLVHAAHEPPALASAPRDRPWLNSLGMPFVRVPGTKVLFCVWLARVEDFEAFVNARGYDATAGVFSVRSDGGRQRGDTWKSPGFAQGPAHPVCGVSWEDAQAFCRWLTETERKQGLIGPKQSYRLPTDAEWSVAVGLNEEGGARPEEKVPAKSVWDEAAALNEDGGATPKEKGGKVKDIFDEVSARAAEGATPKDKDRKVKGVYPWGSSWPPPSGAGNYAGSELAGADWPWGWETIEGYRDAYARTSPVGSFRANRFGLYDMGGNLWQWCEDWYDAEQKFRALRGGSWLDSISEELLSASRNSAVPELRSDVFGFRCVVVMGSPH